MPISVELRDKWVSALRSGKYGQITGDLYDGENGYCCLGVLCEIGMENPWARNVDGERLAEDGGDFYANRNIFNIPIGGSDETWSQARLAKMNDDGASFAEIADYIEKYADTATTQTE